MSTINFQALTPTQKADFTDRCWWEEMGVNHDNEVIQDAHWFQIVTSSTPSLMANGVMRCEVDDGSIDERIRKTIDIYRAKNLPFHWTVSPSSKPHDLGQRLLGAGMTLGAIHDGIVCDPHKIKIAEPPNVTVEPLSAKTLNDYTAMLAHSCFVEDHALRRLHHQVEHQLESKRHWVSHFLARLDGVPAGICQNRYHKGYVHQLGGSVKPESRKNGVLAALLRRLNIDAVEKGFGIVVCHAPHARNPRITASSHKHNSPSAWMPIADQKSEGMMLHLGYEKTCEYEMYQWRPN
jgi:hypothetical protein